MKISKFVAGVNYPKKFDKRTQKLGFGGFNYRGFDSIDEFNQFAKQRNNVAQLIRFPTRYLYFDFDKLALVADDVLPFIQTFLNKINTKLTTELELKDFQIHSKTKNGLVVSIHLISSVYAMKATEMEDLVSDINDEYADDCIYKRGRMFFNCFNGKTDGTTFEYDDRFNQTEYKFIWIDNAKDESAVMLSYKQPPQIEKTISSVDGLAYLIEHKNEYLSKSRYWKLLMSVVKRDNLMSREEYCLKTMISPHTQQDNIDAWNEENFVNKYTIEDVFRKITKHMLTTRVFNKDFYDYVGILTTAQKQYFTDAESDASKVTFKIDNITFNKKTGILTIGDKVHFYYYDIALSRMKTSEENFNNITLEDVPNLVQQFINKKITNLFVKALYGVGKTYHILRKIIEYAQINGVSLIFITENNTLNRQLSKKYNISSHLDKSKERFNIVISSLESIRKYQDAYEIVIVDEVVSVLAHYTSTTFKKNSSYECFTKMMRILENSHQRVFCDADLSFSKYKMFFNGFKQDNELVTRITDNPYTNSDFKLWTIDFDWIYQVKNNGKRIAMPCNTNGSCLDIRDACIENKFSFLIITGDGVCLNQSVFNKKDAFITDVKTNIYKYLTEHKIQVFAYSPTISTGFSIDEEYFHRVYAIIKHYTDGIVSRGFIQMLMRCRKLIDKEYNIRITNPKRVYPFETTDHQKNQLTEDENVFSKYSSKKFFKYDIHEDTMFEANCEKINNTQFVYVLYSYLKSYNFNIEIITECANSSVLAKSPREISVYYHMEITEDEINEVLDFMRYDKSRRLTDIIEALNMRNIVKAQTLLEPFKTEKAVNIKDFLNQSPPDINNAIMLITDNEICDTHSHSLRKLLRKFIIADERQLTYGYFTIPFFLGFKKSASFVEFERLYKFHDNTHSKISRMCSGKYLNLEHIKTSFDAKDYNKIAYICSLYKKITDATNDGVVDLTKLEFDDNDIENFNRYKSVRTEKAFDTSTNRIMLITMANKLIKNYFGMEIEPTKSKTTANWKRIEEYKTTYFNYKFPANNWQNELIDGVPQINEDLLEKNVKFYDKNIKKKPTGFKNKFGSKNPKRLRDVYANTEATYKHTISQWREYEITPNKKTISLCQQISPNKYSTEICEQVDSPKSVVSNILEEIFTRVVDGDEKASFMEKNNRSCETISVCKIKENIRTPHFFDCLVGMKVNFPTPIV